MAAKQDAIAVGEMRLIFKGKILKDEETLEFYKITDGLTVHLVKGGGNKPAMGTGQTASASNAGSTAPTQAPNVGNPTGAGAAGMGGMPGMGGMGGMPGMPGMGMGMPGGMGGMGGMGGGMPNPQMM